MEASFSLFGALRGSVCRRCLRRQHLLSASTSSARSPAVPASRAFSSSSSKHEEQIKAASTYTPRWKRTPPSLVAPVRTRPRPAGPIHRVNDDPTKLDHFYAEFLGDSDPKLQLSEEVRWLAVTHKSFDHGKRGFNDRLAFLGKRIVDLQTSLALLEAPSFSNSNKALRDSYQRPIFYDQALGGTDQLTESNKSQTLDKRRLAQLAESYGMENIVRWKPRKTTNLSGSGLESVLAQTLYAIIGAISLEKGGALASHVVKERILKPLGL